MGDFPKRSSKRAQTRRILLLYLPTKGMPRRAAVLCMFLWCGTALALRIVPGERASSPSIDELNGKWARPGTEARPVVLNGAAKEWPAMKWNLDDLKTKCGSRALEQTCQGDSQVLRTYDKNATGKMWGGMQTVDGPKQGITTFGDYVDAVHKGQDLYLHDAGIDSLCPELLNDLRAPKYFQIDLQKQLPDAIRNRHKCNTTSNGGPTHPGIFLGESKSITGLHIDSRATRFWMAVLSGTKTFRLVNPRYIDSLAPLYSPNPNGILLNVDLFAPDEQRNPSLRDLEVLEFTMHPGDIIFIPEGWPHQVRNEERSIAVSYNFIDMATLAGHEKYLENSVKYLAPRSTDQTIAGLQMIWMKMSKDFPVIKSNYYGGDVPWHEFFSAQRCNISHTSLFDNMTPAQSVESLRLMGESMTPEQEQEIAEEQANLHNEHGDEDDHLSAADLQAAKSDL